MLDLIKRRPPKLWPIHVVRHLAATETLAKAPPMMKAGELWAKEGSIAAAKLMATMALNLTTRRALLHRLRRSDR
jgi:hypothetical protein